MSAAEFSDGIEQALAEGVIAADVLTITDMFRL